MLYQCLLHDQFNPPVVQALLICGLNAKAAKAVGRFVALTPKLQKQWAKPESYERFVSKNTPTISASIPVQIFWTHDQFTFLVEGTFESNEPLCN